jgi:predicted SprT family Zn-dependent metalloprotease
MELTPRQQVLNKCNEVMAKAKELYGLDLSKVAISFDLKGRCAGWAQMRFGSCTVKFNYDMITRGDTEALRNMIEDTVPHEYAHIVCFIRRELGKNHNYGWAQVCRALGGTGERTHDTEVVYGKGTTYEYTSDRGHKIRMSDKYHRQVQMGIPVTYRRGLGKVHIGCAYSIVGVGGRTLATPVVKKAETTPVNSPANIEAFIKERMALPLPTAGLDLNKPAKLVPVKQWTPPKTIAPSFNKGQSKADIARAIMLSGHTSGKSYEEIIAAIMLATGHDRQLSRSYYKNNAAKIGVPPAP